MFSTTGLFTGDVDLVRCQFGCRAQVGVTEERIFSNDPWQSIWAVEADDRRRAWSKDRPVRYS